MRVPRSRPGQDAFATSEVLIAAFIVGIAATGIALMLSTGMGTIYAHAEERVALYLAQQKIEHLRGGGFTALCASDVANPGCSPPSTCASYSVTCGCIATASFPTTDPNRPGEPCYTEAPPAQPPYIYSSTSSGGTMTYTLVTTFPKYTRTTLVECIDPANLNGAAITCPATPLAKRVTVTVTPDMRQARPTVLQTVMTLH